MAAKRKVLFLQLPQLDNDVSGPNENLHLAAAYLQHAAEQAGEGRHHQFFKIPESAQQGSTVKLVESILELKPDVIAATLYLWNIEWTLRLLKAVSAYLPQVRFVVGGPETAHEHPFLFQSRVAQAVVVGEGETVFPSILEAFRTGRSLDYSTVALLTPHGYRWGKTVPPPVDLATALPPPDYPACGPNTRGMAYVETSRGCPMRCTYCRYPHLRRTLSFLAPEAIEERVRALRRLGACEIRFIDPTFNAHPRSTEILQRLVRLNRSRKLCFFAELNADRITEEAADLLSAANFVDIEVGVQSRDAAVLREIRRPTNLDRLEEGVRRLSRRHIKVTLDLMYGLPRQGLDDLRHSLPWALRFRGVNVQCLQTLLLPGTELRARHGAWQIKSGKIPPYAVTSTRTLSPDDFRTIEEMIARHPRLRSDIATGRFVGRQLPDLFPEAIAVEAGSLTAATMPPGSGNRRAVMIRGANLFDSREALAGFIRRAIHAEPDTLFQFVLQPENEEPLDLLDTLIATLRRCPSHLLDRYASAAIANKMAARRILVRLPPAPRFDPDWIREAEELLAAAFF
jgi:radical SAM superfamily enzyme YgiQ (UPF0313 family)